MAAVTIEQMADRVAGADGRAVARSGARVCPKSCSGAAGAAAQGAGRGALCWPRRRVMRANPKLLLQIDRGAGGTGL